MQIKNKFNQINSDISILLITGLLFYIINYVIGLLLFYKKIFLPKRLHQLLFAAIIINLILILIFETLPAVNFLICSISLILMLILPAGKKGGRYHIIVSSSGLMFYVALILFVC